MHLYGLHLTTGPAAVFIKQSDVEEAVNSLRIISNCTKIRSRSIGRGRTITLEGKEGEHTISRADRHLYGL